MMRPIFLLIVLLLSFSSASGWSWQDLWSNQNEQGAKLLSEGNADQAAATFTDPAWKAVSEYRAAEYEQAVTDFAEMDTPLANYNRGNALARLGEYKKAIAAYDKALEQQADFPDAEYNRELIERLLQQQQQQEQSQQEQQQQQNQDQQQEQDASDQNDQQQQEQSQQQQNDQTNEQQQDQAAEQPNQQHSNEDQQSEPETESEQQSEQSQQAEQDDSQLQQAHAADQKPAQQSEEDQSMEQWLQRVPDNPGGLLRQKFLRDYQRRMGG